MSALIRTVVLPASLLLVLGCQGRMGRMGQMGGMEKAEHGMMSGREMAEAMHDPDTMQEWMSSMMGSPELMGDMMRRIHEELRSRAAAGETVPVYCPLMGFTPQNPPAPEKPYEAGSLSAQELFSRKCSRCHALPDPHQHTAAEWRDVVKRMEQYIEGADFVNLSPEEGASILRYLQAQAG